MGVIFKGNKHIIWQHCNLKTVADKKKRFTVLESAPKNSPKTAVALPVPDKSNFLLLCATNWVIQEVNFFTYEKQYFQVGKKSINKKESLMCIQNLLVIVQTLCPLSIYYSTFSVLF